MHMHAQLIRLIGKWEKSGQGDGGHTGVDDCAFGALADRQRNALDSRAQFLGRWG